MMYAHRPNIVCRFTYDQNSHMFHHLLDPQLNHHLQTLEANSEENKTIVTHCALGCISLFL